MICKNFLHCVKKKLSNSIALCVPERKSFDANMPNKGITAIYVFIAMSVASSFRRYKWKMTICNVLWRLKLLLEVWVNIIILKEINWKPQNKYLEPSVKTTGLPLTFLLNDPGLVAANPSWEVRPSPWWSLLNHPPALS